MMKKPKTKLQKFVMSQALEFDLILKSGNLPDFFFLFLTKIGVNIKEYRLSQYLCSSNSTFIALLIEDVFVMKTRYNIMLFQFSSAFINF